MPPASRYIRFISKTSELPDPQSFALDPGRREVVAMGGGSQQPGVFSTLRTHLDSQVFASAPASHILFGLERHIARLLSDAEALGFLEPLLNLHQAVWLQNETRILLRTFIEDFKLQATPVRTRLVLRPELSLEIYFDCYLPPWSALRSIRLVTVSDERLHPLQKTTLLDCSHRARQVAGTRGADEALLIDSNCNIREGAWSNLFWFDRKGTLHTIGERVLPGITRQVLLDAQTCSKTEIALKQLLEDAEEVFITQSTTGITSVGMIDGHLIHEGTPGPRTIQLQEWYAKQISTAGIHLAYVH